MDNTMNTERFSNKVVVVTGGASGIGAAAVDRFLREGASVAALDVGDEALGKLADDHSQASDRLMTATCDVSDSAMVDSAVAEVVSRFGRIDVLINNAGVGGVGKAGDVSDEDWRKVMAVDLDGIFFTARAALPHLIEAGGNIVNTASISGLAGDKSMVAYDTAKGAVVNFTRATAVDYGKAGVRVNAVCPGPVRTPILAEALDQKEISDIYEERIPLGYVSDPEDMAGVMAFLASADARMITGINIPVDGGLTAWTAQPDISVGLSH